MTLLLLLLIIPLLSFIFLSSSIFYSNLLPKTMMSFYKKITPHSLLNLTAAMSSSTSPPPPPNTSNHIPSSITGGLLGLVSTSPNDVAPRYPLVLESFSLNKRQSGGNEDTLSSLPPLPSFLPPPATKTTSARGGSDIGGFGFLDEVGGGKDGFVSCTESLGFESSDEITRVDDQVELDEEEVELSLMRKSENKRSEWRRMRDKRSSVVDKDNNNTKFPPPISSLNKNGHPNFYLRPVRKDGRLELTEVRIHRRPEILCAYREDGRLRMHLISHEANDDQEDDENDHEDEVAYVHEDDDNNNNNNNNNNVEEVNDGDQWKIGEGFRRCQDNMTHHHHHNNHNVWRQQHCVV